LKQFLGLKIQKLFDMEPDPGFGIRSLFDPGSGIWDGKIQIRDKHPDPQYCCPLQLLEPDVNLYKSGDGDDHVKKFFALFTSS
jgi:hypothetical protein